MKKLTENVRTVVIPGVIYATYDHNVHGEGIITKMVFTPHASDPGHRFAAAHLFEGQPLDVEETDGPFWTAVQETLKGMSTDGVDSIGWEE